MIKTILTRKKEVSLLGLMISLLSTELIGFTVCFFFYMAGLLDRLTHKIETGYILLLANVLISVLSRLSRIAQEQTSLFPSNIEEDIPDGTAISEPDSAPEDYEINVVQHPVILTHQQTNTLSKMN